MCCSEPNYRERARHPLPFSLEAVKEEQSLLGGKLCILSLKSIILFWRVSKYTKLYFDYLQKDLSCWPSPSKTGLIPADMYFTPDQCQEVLWSHSWYDPKPTYIRGNSYLDGFKIRCRVRRKVIFWYFFLEMYFTGRGELFCLVWFHIFIFIHLKPNKKNIKINRAVSLGKMKYWNAQAQITSAKFPKSTGSLANPLNWMFQHRYIWLTFASLT